MYEDFKMAIRATGLVPPDHITAGKIICFAGLNKPKTNKAARCLLFEDRRGGWFMDYSTGLFETWQAKRATPYSPQERQAFKERCERDRLAREQERDEAQKQAAIKAREMWERAIYADTGNLYLHRKQIKPHGAKTGDSGGLKGVLILPIYNENLKLVNLQFIDPRKPKGQDRNFLTSGQKKHCFWWVGKKSETILIAEGFATACSIHQTMGHQVFIAFDAGNLANVAKIVKAKNPTATIIIAGDNDHSGTGQKAARAAALAIGCKYILPPTVGHDWNDHVNAIGSQLVTNLINKEGGHE